MLNRATRNYHFFLPFIHQLLKRLADKEFYCFVDGYKGTTRMLLTLMIKKIQHLWKPIEVFWFCNATTFGICMMSIFSNLIEDIIKVLIEDFNLFGDSFTSCLNNLSKVPFRCEETSLVLDWKIVILW